MTKETETGNGPEYTHKPMALSKQIIKLTGRKEKRHLEGGGVVWVVTSAGVRAVIQGLAEKQSVIGVNAHKLLCVAMCLFAEQNPTQHEPVNTETLQCLVQVSLREFAAKCGYKVSIYPPGVNATPEEREQDENRLHEARAQIRQNLITLQNCYLEWNQKTPTGKVKRTGDYVRLSLIGSHSIRKGIVSIAFDPMFAKYLVTRPLTQFPEILLALDSRSPTAYGLGLAIAVQANMYTNIKQGTADRQKVSSLLENTPLPGLGEVRMVGKSWWYCIKEPFEKALEDLVRVGFLRDWCYCGVGGVDLSDDQADFSDFATWSKTLVRFELQAPVDHTKRMEAKRKRRTKKPVLQVVKG